jgi:hypothetical protein
VLDAFPGPRIISTTSKYYNDFDGTLCRETTPFVDWLERRVTSPGDVQSGGSVATSLFDFLLNCGCSEIILVGQDLAYTGREIHCSGTHHNDDWQLLTSRFRGLDTINQNIIRKRQIRHVPAFGGRGTVVSDFVLSLYREWFEDSAARVSIPVINATGGGARIANTREEDIAVLAASLPLRGEDIRRALAGHSAGGSSAAAVLRADLEAAAAILQQLAAMPAENGAQWSAMQQAAAQELVSGMLGPWVKKSEAYVLRHPGLDPARQRDICAGDLRRAAAALLPVLRRTLRRLEKKTPDSRNAASC